ncbi:selenium metabolism-associated LysR family transcriptional regulator [Anaerovorax odorimutans]|uniref:Selenium metabolism-associated LysR family transcriptional regulator n=1 Tax=Anaerovorax odorimutans TaxID=109327 RepID=A0ABT1RMN7_9FIRM|nr:selenium metabolism-associated LysR family transcriptional regulator [Anaerovorax odorimutans]MCQ4636456.1 selenium metabolism-associated LysR family transcriptional regulator [Anaerovorax odorimutans]
MDFRQIEAYVNVVKQKSFSKAAYISNVKQPTISSHVNALEREMGVKLIDRTHREARPTPEGQVFYDYAINMINLRETAMYSVKGFQKNISGIIRIHASNFPAEYILPDLIKDFSDLYPNVKFQIEQYDSKQVLKNMLENKAEVGFTGVKGSYGLTYMPLFEDELVVITPKEKAYEDLIKDTVKVSEIAAYPLIFREQGSGTRKLIEAVLMRDGIQLENLNLAVIVNNNAMVKRFVKKGMGIAVISKCAVEKEDEDVFHIIEIDNLGVKRKFYLTYNKKITGTPTVNLFKSFVEERFK